MVLDARVPATIQDLRLYLLKDQDDDAQDARIIVMANSAIGRIEAHIGGPVLARNLVETQSGRGGMSSLFTLAKPLISITSVTIDGAVTASTYTFNPRTGQIGLTSGTFTAGVGNIVIALRAGYELASVPPDLIEAFLAYTKWLYDEKETGTLMANSVTVGPSTITAKFGMPESIKLALNPYRDTRF